MNDTSQSGYFILISVVISLLFHALIWQLAERMDVKLYSQQSAIERSTRPVTVRSVNLEELVQPRLQPRKDTKDRLITEQEDRLHKLFREENLVDRPVPELKPQLTGLGRDLLKKVVAIPTKRAEEAIGIAPQSSPPPEIVAIQARELPASRTMDNRRIIPDIERKVLTDAIVPSVASATPGGTGLGQPEQVELGMRLRLPDRQPNELPPLPPVQRPTLPPDSVTTSRPEVITPPANVLDSLMQVSVAVFWDERRGDGFFEIKIMPNERADRLVTIPKDVLFLVDCSGSIGWRKLREFRDGLKASLDYLQPEDRFNIVAFRESPDELFPRLMPVNEATVAEAHKFLDGLRSRGKTDVYSSLSPYVMRERADKTRPYLIFMLSDGRTTTGEELANSEFIRRVTNHNVSEASLFSFSAGLQVNLFLMDFLSYKNRGLSIHADKIDDTVSKLTAYIGGLTDIVVADPVCRITGDLQDEVYPEQLQHLFRGNPLTVYGRVPSGTEKMGIQILGKNRTGEAEELIISADLATANVAEAELATRWAAQKIYHLIARWTLSNDAAIRDEIQALSREYGIVVPYIE